MQYLARLVWDSPENRVHYDLLFEKAADRAFHAQVKSGKRLRFLTKEIEEIPLRHHRDERRRRRKVRKVADLPSAARKAQLGAVQLGVRARQEALENPELVEDLHR